MKRMVTTKVSPKYILKYYQLKKRFDYSLLYRRWDGMLRYEDCVMLNESSYQLKWKQEFNSFNEVKKLFQTWYPNQRYMSCHTSVVNLVKARENGAFVLTREGEELDNEGVWQFVLKKKKMPHGKKKKHRHYYCDCWHCTGTTPEVRARIERQDLKKLEVL